MPMSRAEARFRHHVVGQLERNLVGDDRRVAVRNVGERPGVHRRRLPLHRLHQVGHDGVLHQDRRRARHAQVFHRHRLARLAGADHAAADAFAQILQAGGQRQDRHDLRRHGDVVARDPRVPLLVRPQPDLDLAQEAVADVDHPVPGDARRVDVQDGKARPFLRRQFFGVGLGDAQLLQPAQHGRREGALALLVLRAQPVEHRLRVDLGLVQHAGVDRRRDQVVRRGDGVDVARQVQVEVLHRHHLAVAAAGRAALDAEGRPLRRLADRRHHALAQHAQPLRQADGGRGLALAQRRRRDGRHVDVLALRPVGELLQHIQVDLGLVLAVQVQVVGAESQRRRDVEDRLQFRGLRNLQVARDGIQTLHGCCLRVEVGDRTLQ